MKPRKLWVVMTVDNTSCARSRADNLFIQPVATKSASKMVIDD